MNVFAEIARPIVSRPGMAMYIPPPPKARPVKARISDAPDIDNPWGLSGRECQVLQSIVKFRTAKETALFLGLELKTIECHTIKLRKKMGARSSIEAALMWDRLQRSQE